MGRKKILFGSILAVALLTMVSLSNVVGYNTVKSSQVELIESKYSFDECKDYLFETLVEISDNPEIKDIIKSNYKPQRTMLPFRRNNVDFKVEHLDLLYEMGLKLVDRLGEERVEELMENIEIPDYVDELDAIVMGNDELKDRIYTLNEMNNEKMLIADYDTFPIVCLILETIINCLSFILVNVFQPINSIILFIYFTFFSWFYNGFYLAIGLMTIIQSPVFIPFLITFVIWFSLCIDW